VGGYIHIPEFLAPLTPLPPVVASLEHLEHTLLYVSVAIAAAGVGLAVWLYGGPPARVDSLTRRMKPVHALLSGKYFVDELYDRLLARPLVWISDRILLRLVDRLLLDGTLNTLGALAQRTAGVLGRIQTGNLQLYALLVMLGLVGALLWGWRGV
jgi:NADH-quinone oxidoreductase subunit L